MTKQELSDLILNELHANLETLEIGGSPIAQMIPKSKCRIIADDIAEAVNELVKEKIKQ